LEAELVGSVGSGMERSGRKASHPGRTAVGRSTQPCKASKRAFAWLEKGNCKRKRQQDKGKHHEIPGQGLPACKSEPREPGGSVGYHLPQGSGASQHRQQVNLGSQGSFYLQQEREPGLSLPKPVPEAGLGALFTLQGSIVPKIN